MHIRTIAVIGAGAVGREIAYAATSAGYATIVEDISRIRLNEAVAWITHGLDAVNRRNLDPSARDTERGRLTTATTVEDVFAEADLIIETTADEMEMKLELVTIFDKFARRNAIFASSGSLSITEMAEVTYRADRCIGMHFSDAVAGDRVLELVRGSKTSQETVDRCAEVGRSMGRKVFVVTETQGRADGSRETKSPESKAASV